MSDTLVPLALQKDMPAVKKRNAPSLSAAREFWSLSVSPKDAASDTDTVLVVNEDHEQGHTKVGQRQALLLDFAASLTYFPPLHRS